jgi:hypothetical protein
VSEEQTELIGSEEVDIRFEDELFPDRISSRGLIVIGRDCVVGFGGSSTASLLSLLFPTPFVPRRSGHDRLYSGLVQATTPRRWLVCFGCGYPSSSDPPSDRPGSSS